MLASLLGRHSQLCDVVEEIRFHAEPDGLPGLLEGRIDLDAFLAKLQSRWWRFEQPWGKVRGLHLLVTPDEFQDAVRRFETSYESDPERASRELIDSLLGSVASRAGRVRWVESTPPVVQAAPTLARLFPDMRMVHIWRDGRDVAASVAEMPWGPNDRHEALSWWGAHMRRGRAAARRLPPDRVMELELENLVVSDREGSYRRLLEFAQIDDEPGMREYFETEVVAANANIGRWREPLSPPEEARFSAAYREELAALGGAAA